MELASEGDSYDELKSADGQHTRAAELLIEVLKGVSTREVSSRADQLRAILGTKDRVSYTGTFYRLEDASLLLRQVADFATWADAMYQRRPI